MDCKATAYIQISIFSRLNTALSRLTSPRSYLLLQLNSKSYTTSSHLNNNPSPQRLSSPSPSPPLHHIPAYQSLPSSSTSTTHPTAKKSPSASMSHRTLALDERPARYLVWLDSIQFEAFFAVSKHFTTWSLRSCYAA